MKGKTMFIVFRKEIRDMFRDKRTIFSAILIPLLLLPLIYGIIGKVVTSEKKSVEKNIKIAIKDDSGSSLGNYLKGIKKLTVVSSSDMSKDVQDGKISVGVEINQNFDANVDAEKTSQITAYYDNTSNQSDMAWGIIKSYIDAYSKQVVSSRLAKRNINTELLNPVDVQEKTAVKESDAVGKQMLGMMLPMLLTLYCISGPMAAAVDQGAGEKERGTMEPLLTTQASRMSLLCGKFMSITVMGLITTVATLVGLAITFSQSNSLFSVSGSSLKLDPGVILAIGAITLLTTMVFGALELSISVYARSAKEAQTFLTPLTIIGMIPIFAVYMADVKNLSFVYYNIPVTNMMCVLKEFLAGIYNPLHVAVTIGWTLVYVVISISLAVYMFRREEVIFRA